jgi:hypothetical protein
VRNNQHASIGVERGNVIQRILNALLHFAHRFTTRWTNIHGVYPAQLPQACITLANRVHLNPLPLTLVDLAQAGLHIHHERIVHGGNCPGSLKGTNQIAGIDGVKRIVAKKSGKVPGLSLTGGI